MRKIRKHSNTFNSITLSIITLRKETKQCPPPHSAAGDSDFEIPWLQGKEKICPP